MNNMHPRPDGALPEELRALDEELSSIRYEERPSFGPELRAELARAWALEGGQRRASSRRHLAAAVVAALLVGGAAVPSARASLVRFIGSLGDAPTELSVLTSESTGPTAAPAPVEPAAMMVAAPMEDLGALSTSVDAPAPVLTESVVIAPVMLDRAGAEELLQTVYPPELQRRGVGGTVWLRMWVGEMGLPGSVEVSRSSGVGELDQAALRVAPQFRFEPALQDGRRRGSWIEFPVLFEPDSDRVERVLKPVVDPLSLPTIPREDWWQLREPLDLEGLPPVASIGASERRARAEASAELAGTLTGTDVDRHGPAEAILDGEPPEGVVAPTQWRAAVGSALEDALEGGAEQPTALLALGRIRMRQGLRAEARGYFERGLRMAIRAPDEVSDWVVAELHYERGELVRDRWLGSDGIGRVRSEVFASSDCAPARSSGRAATGYASVDRLIAWNYLCPDAMGSLFMTGFETAHSGSAGDLTLMMASMRAAMEAYPGHVGANTHFLVTLAQEERWDDLLSGARRFVRTSEGHPNGLLLAGLALHRLERTHEAASHFEAALARMTESEADEISDVSVLLDGSDARAYARLSPAERRTWEEGYWARQVRDGAQDVNEPWVEHMARTAYARLRFGDVFGDAAEVWVRFGRPDNVHVVDEGNGRLTEFWDYGSGPDITFVRWVSAHRTDLTPEGRAYVDDLGNIRPPQ